VIGSATVATASQQIPLEKVGEFVDGSEAGLLEVEPL
jgi:hypothetical protein